ncbi:MAG: hypothetical protein NC489_31705 [Ruminococcus flavefaciens]|nr:hypothetical protein [Ruminococcus flavefaciens]
MRQEYYEFDSEQELNKHLKYWSNACGDLHHHGEYDLESENELPDELRRAYNELWKEENGCYEYLAEFDGKYYIALISEWDNVYAHIDMTMDEIYESVKKDALELHGLDLFKDTVLVTGKETGFEGCHEFIFLVPAMAAEETYDEIERSICANLGSALKTK